MSLIEKLAINIGLKSKLILNIDDDHEKIIIYGAINLLQMICAIVWTMIISLIFGVFYEAMIFSIVVSILRKYSGGVHASSPNRCVFIGTLIATGIGLLISRLLYKINTYLVGIVGVIFILIALLIIIKKAPVDSNKKPINNIKIKQKFKFISIMLICSYLVIMLVLLKLYLTYNNLMYIKVFQCIALGTLWQSITLTGNGAKILNKLDAVLKYIFERRELL